MSRKAFVTGVGGFVGRYLAKRLKQESYRITGLLGPDEPAHPWLKESCENLVVGDLLDIEALSGLISRSKPDVVIHLAAMSAPAKSFAYPQQFFDVNVIGTQNILESVRKLQTNTRVAIFSSSDVYGYVQPDELPLSEESPLRPANPYAASKVACHLLAQQYTLNFGVEVVEIRPFNMIGPEQALGFVLPDFASQVAEIIKGKRTKEIQVGRLTDKRDFLDVRDAVLAMRDIIEKGKGGEAYNICSGKPRPVDDILSELQAQSPVQFRVLEDKARLRPTKMPIHYGSNSKAAALNGWQPSISFSDTIGDTLEYWLAQV